MATPVLQFKRGASDNIGVASFKAGEPGFTTDKYDFYIGLDGTADNQQFFGSSRYWNREVTATGSEVRLIESIGAGGTHYVALRSPASLDGDVTYTLPGSDATASGDVLTSDGSGTLSWVSPGNLGFSNPVFTGIATFTGDNYSATWTQTNNAFKFGDNARLLFGEGSDLQIFHNTALTGFEADTNYITAGSNGGDINIQPPDSGYVRIKGIGNGGTIARFDDDGPAHLYNNGSEKFLTTGIGVSIHNGDEEASVISGPSNLIIDPGSTDVLIRTGSISGVGISTITGISTSNISVNDSIQEIDGIVSLGTTVLSIGDSEIVMSQVSLAAAADETFIFTDQSQTGNTIVVGDLYANKNLRVSGTSTFVGNVTFQGGTIGIGDADTDDISVAGEFISSLVPSVDDTHDLGSTTQKWAVTRTHGLDYEYQFGAVGAGGTLTYEVTVGTQNDADRYNGSGSSSKYRIEGEESPFITLVPGRKYKFDQSHASNATHPLLFYREADRTTSYGIGVSVVGTPGQAGAYTEIEITDATPPILYYQCSAHAYMGNAIVIPGSSAGTLNLSDGTNTGSVDLISQSLTFNGTTEEIEVGVSNQTVTIGLPDTITVTTVKASNVKANDGTNAITIADSTGDVGIASNLTVTGNLSVLGTQAIVNTETLKVEDSLIEVGLINDNGDLVAPTSDLNYDIGLLMHYFDGGAKKAAVFYDDSVSRLVLASEVSESNSVITIDSYANVEVGSLVVSDDHATGEDVIAYNSTSSQRELQNIVIDCGTFA